MDAEKVSMLKQGRSYIKHLASEKVASWIHRGMLDPTNDMSRLAEADALMICVPTPLNASRDPDLQYIESTSAAIAAVLRPGQARHQREMRPPSATHTRTICRRASGRETQTLDVALRGRCRCVC